MRVIVGIFAFALFNYSIAQKDYRGKEKTFIGTLFTSAKFVTPDNFPNDSILNEYVLSWNVQQIKEFGKYDLKKALRLDVLEIDIEPTKKANGLINWETREKPPKITEGNIDEVISVLDLEQFDGLVICYVVDKFDKINQMATIWFVVIDTKTKKSILSHKFQTHPSGFGVRNYWLNCFYELVKDIRRVSHQWR